MGAPAQSRARSVTHSCGTSRYYQHCIKLVLLGFSKFGIDVVSIVSVFVTSLVAPTPLTGMPITITWLIGANVQVCLLPANGCNSLLWTLNIRSPLARGFAEKNREISKGISCVFEGHVYLRNIMNNNKTKSETKCAGRMIKKTLRDCTALLYETDLLQTTGGN